MMDKCGYCRYSALDNGYRIVTKAHLGLERIQRLTRLKLLMKANQGLDAGCCAPLGTDFTHLYLSLLVFILLGKVCSQLGFSWVSAIPSYSVDSLPTAF